MRRLLAVAGALGVAAIMTGCGSGDPGGAPAGPTPPGGAPAQVGGSPGTWSPVRISPADDGRTIDLVVDQAAIVTGVDGSAMVLATTDPTVVAVSQAGRRDGYEAAAGLRALAPGRAVVTLAGGGGGPVLSVTVRVR